MHRAFRYVLALPKLVIDARKCQSDIMTLRSNLEDEVPHVLPSAPILPLTHILQVHQLSDH